MTVQLQQSGRSSRRKLIFGGIWLCFSLYAFLLAPPNDPNTVDQILALSTGQWGELNPVIVALFNLMGVWPMIYGAVALVDGHCQPSQADEGSETDSSSRLKAWPFVVGSFGLGAFTLLPYLALRAPAPEFKGKPSVFLKIFTSRLFSLFLLGNAITWIGYAIAQGDWANFATQWQNSRFIHVMSLDFCLLTLLFPVLAQDDAKRQGFSSPYWTWATAAVPIIGAAIYLCLRPAVAEVTEVQTQPLSTSEA